MITPRLLLADNAAAFAELAAERIAAEVRAAIDTHGRCSLALSGGTTPRPVYERLAHPDLDYDVQWCKVDIHFSDERCVPRDDPASNFRMAWDAMLKHLLMPRTRIHRMEGERLNHDAAAADYEARLPLSLDVLLLGVGFDGHTASLFPESPALDERVRRVVPSRSPEPPHWRLTITPPVIEDARSVIVLAAGEDKALAVARALREPFEPRRVPAQLALRGTWILDRAAAELAQQVAHGTARGAEA